MRKSMSLSDPGQGCALLVPADSDYASDVQYRALYIGVAGNVRVTTTDGNDVVFSNHPVGYMPISTKRLWSTNTTASLIIGIR